MSGTRSNSREKILTAAAEVARESGPGNLSLDAVAARAGVSKGGLLYNFPNKAKLMQSLVESYVAELERALDLAVAEGESLSVAFVRHSAAASDEDQAPASWIFSAIAEDPEFLSPVTENRQRLLARLKRGTSDVAGVLVIFLAMEGLLSMKLFNSEILSQQDRVVLFDRMLSMAAGLPAADA